jgi:hypothetical protein
MQELNSRIWKLTRLQPYFILVMFLMLMNERFFAKIGGRHFRQMLSGSPILPQLLTIMSDTQAFPFFSRGDLLKMLTCHGATLHLLRALCGPTTNINRRIMHLILERIVSRIASNPMVASCFERCSIALQTYPVSIPGSQICFEIYDKNIVSKLGTIWELLSLCTVLPKAKAILDISSANLSDVQMKTYDKLYMIIIFRRLFESRNRVFILLCKYFHLVKKYEEQRRSDGCFVRLRKRIEKELQLQRASHDFKVYMYYLHFLFTKLLPSELSVNLIDDSFNILGDFKKMMIEVHSIYEKDSDSMFGGRYVPTSSFAGISEILEQEDEETLLEQLKNGLRKQEKNILKFCVSPPNHSSPEWLFSLLQRANSLYVSQIICEKFEGIVKFMESGCYCKDEYKNRFARLMLIVVKFAWWSQSDHPHRHFIFQCISFMKQARTTKIYDLAKILDIQKFQDSTDTRLHDLYKLIKTFCNFADQSMGCCEMTERSLLYLFNMMQNVLSHPEFFISLSGFLKTLENETVSWKIGSMCICFLDVLRLNPQFKTIIQDITYYRLTNCKYCTCFLSRDNNTGLCPICVKQDDSDSDY